VKELRIAYFQKHSFAKNLKGQNHSSDACYYG